MRAAPTLLPEWAPQSGVLLAWPHPDSDWGSCLPAIEAEYTALACAIAEREAPLILCHDEAHRVEILRLLQDAGIPASRLHLACIEVDDTWIRDYGPLAVGDGTRLELVDFAFNAWGGKYPHARDARVTATLHERGLLGAAPLRREPLVVEGGALESDGRGTLLTTAGCLDSVTRNPGLDRAQLEARLCATLGLRRVVWLDVTPLPGDDTDGHVDTLARFCDPGTIAHAVCSSRDDSAYAALADLEAQLKALRTLDGAPYRLVPLPLPAPQLARDGRRLAATHANFLVLNGAVLCPVYGDPADEVAMRHLAEAFTGREIVGVPARTLIEENGSLHCATMQLPAGLLPAGEPGGASRVLPSSSPLPSEPS